MKKITTILIILTVIVLLSCKKKTIEPINNQKVFYTSLINYKFIGQMQIVYDFDTQSYSAISYSSPSDYPWENDTLFINDNNTFTGGFGVGNYNTNLDTLLMSTNNWVGTDNLANMTVKKGKYMPLNAVKGLYLDTVMNASIFGADSAFAVYLVGKQPNMNNKMLRITLFKKY